MDPDAIDDLLAEAGAAEAQGGGDETGPGRVPHGSVDDPEVLDFSANTNPRIPDGVGAVYRDALADARTYPDDDYPAFRGAAAHYGECDADQVVPTPGGLAAIRLAIATTVDSGDSVLVPYPSFGEYAREVRLQGATPEFVPAADLLTADPTAHALAIVCRPNNPTGAAYDLAALRSFAERCREADKPLLVDEAFLGFTDRESLAGTPGVVVARSLTKMFGLPGIRAGFAVATDQLRDRIAVARRAWNLGTPAAAVGAHCMRQDDFVAATRERVETERARMADRLASRFAVHDSDAPFLLLETESSAAVDDLLATVADEGIAIRDARTFRGLDCHVRVAVRLPAENDRLLEAMDV
ncbi:threonine-phosphate decarboxylase [Halobacteriales archaeon Cl-PHB]